MTYQPAGPPPAGPGYPPGPPRPVPMEPATDPTIADWWQRLIARIIDGFAISLVASPVYILYFIWMFSRMFDAIDKAAKAPLDQPTPVVMPISPAETMLGSFGIAVVVAIIGFGYDWLCHGKWGMTIGKRILRLKVVRAGDRSPVTGGMAAKRALAYPGAGIVPLLGSLFALVDTIWWFNDRPLRQCLHDKFAETIVIRTDPPRPAYPPPGSPAYGPGYAPGPGYGPPQGSGPSYGPPPGPMPGYGPPPGTGPNPGHGQAPGTGPAQSHGPYGTPGYGPPGTAPQRPGYAPPPGGAAPALPPDPSHEAAQGAPHHPAQSTPQSAPHDPAQDAPRDPAQDVPQDAPHHPAQDAPHDPAQDAPRDPAQGAAGDAADGPVHGAGHDPGAGGVPGDAR